MKPRWWQRYEVTIGKASFYFTGRRDALWALNLARSLVESTGRDRWTGRAL
jgi:hypothetical protein